jgi:hypothetical protein
MFLSPFQESESSSDTFGVPLSWPEGWAHTPALPFRGFLWRNLLEKVPTIFCL